MKSVDRVGVEDVLVRGAQRAPRRRCRAARSGASPRTTRSSFHARLSDVLHAAVRAARAKRRNEVRRIAANSTRPWRKRFHPAAVRTCRRSPIRSRTRASGPSIARKARQDRSGLLLLVGVGVPAELEIDTPHIVGLAMQQYRLPGMERRVEPEPALGRETPDVMRMSAIRKRSRNTCPSLSESEQPTHRAARAVGDDQPVGVERVIAVGRLRSRQRRAPSTAARRRRLALCQRSIDAEPCAPDRRGTPRSSIAAD